MISVIVPAKDAAGTIRDCINALQCQEGMQLHKDYEVIVVDDGSTDHTADIAENLGVKVVSQPNAGPGAARNAGGRIAAGEILAFTDADCTPAPTWLVNITQPLTNPIVVGVKGTYLTCQTESVARFVQLEYEYKYRRMERQSKIDFIDTYSAAYRKEVFVKNGGFNESFRVLEDQELSSRLARKDYWMVFEPKARVIHRHNRTFSEYLRKKFRIGYWKAVMLRTIPEKTFTDSHTAPTQRAEILLLALFLLSIPLIAIWALNGLFLSLFILFVFFAISIPFLIYTFKRDVRVGWVAPWLLIGRASALGLGLLTGILFPTKEGSKGYPCQSIGVRTFKRSMDLLGGIIGVVLSAPVIACAAIAIRLDSNGPAIFKQLRAGEFGKPFILFKLRSMVEGAERRVPEKLSIHQLNGEAFIDPMNPQVTKVGRFLRRWSLDELPQFWNVLKGDMSLVGPRPEVLSIVEQYTDEQRECLMIKPGLTGPVQVNGRKALDFDQRFQLEVDYLKHYTPLNDVEIILRTLSAVLTGEGIV